MIIGIIDDKLENSMDLNFARIQRFKVRHSKVKQISEKNKNSNMTHSTTCCNILHSHLEHPHNHALVHIDIMNNEQLDIRDFLKAIEFIILQKVDILCLSIGTTILSREKVIYPLIKEIHKNGVFIIAASSNANFVTIPATFNEVIGTIALPSDYFSSQEIYSLPTNELGIDYGIVVESNKGNSFSAPLILAELLNKVDGDNSICSPRDKLYKTLKKEKSCNSDQLNVLIQVFLPKKKVDPPIVTVNTSDFVFYSKIMDCLSESWGYESACVIEEKEGKNDFRIIKLNLDTVDDQITNAFYRNLDILFLTSNLQVSTLNWIDALNCAQIKVRNNEMELAVGNRCIKKYNKLDINKICNDMVLLLQEE